MSTNIAAQINARGCKSQRYGADVKAQIAKLESSFRKASDFLNQTGAGIEDEDTLRECVVKRCPFYYELEDAFGNRPNNQPLATEQDCRPSTVLDLAERDSSDEDLDLDEAATSQVVAAGLTSRPLFSPSPSSTRVDSCSSKSSSSDGRTKRKLSPVHPHPQNGKEKSGIQKRSCHKQVAIVDGLEEQRSSLYDLKREELAMKRREIEAAVGLSTVQTKTANMEYMAKLLKARQELLAGGMSLEDLDKFLPLP